MFLIIATFKSNKTGSEVISWLKQVFPVASSSSAKIALAPSFPYLPLLKPYSSSLLLAAQDVSPFPPGSYTGAVSANQLQDLGVEYCLVGHSERRRYFHETNQEIANKAGELLSAGITPLLCLSQADIEGQFAALDDQIKQKILYVYEPPADIGGTETAPIEEIDKVTSYIHSLAASPVLYGGSVNAGNLKSLLSLPLQGVLVSTASLEASSFIDLINSYEASEKNRGS